MSKENRSIFLVALTYVAFASIGLIRNGSFLFPFPLNELVFFILFLRFAFWHRKERLSILLVGIAASASLLSSSFFWEIILSTTDQAQLFQSTFTDWTALLTGMALLAWSIYTGIQQNQLTAKTVAWMGALLLLLQMIYPWEYTPLLAFVFLSISSYLAPSNLRFQTLWRLLAFLELAKWISLLVNS